MSSMSPERCKHDLKFVNFKHILATAFMSSSCEWHWTLSRLTQNLKNAWILKSAWFFILSWKWYIFPEKCFKMTEVTLNKKQTGIMGSGQATSQYITNVGQFLWRQFYQYEFHILKITGTSPRGQWVNSSPLCRLLGAKPLSQPMLGHCQLDT